MLASVTQRLLLRPALLRALSCCTAEAGAVEGAVPAQPGSVSEYHQHLLVQLPRPADDGGAGGAGGAWWPTLIEKEPAVVAAFAAVAKHEDIIAGKVKITAFDDVPSTSGRTASKGPAPGTCNMLAFPAGLRFDGLSLEQVGHAAALSTAADPKHVPLSPAQRKALTDRLAPTPDLTLLVCCHAARDARCGAAGPPLAAALQRLVRARGAEDHVRVLQTSHIGGHKYAGNVVAYGVMHPCDGDWFGGLHAGNAEPFLDALLNIDLGVDGGAGDPALRPFWRGRMGLEKLEQADLFQSGGVIEDLAEGPLEGEEEEDEEESEEERRLFEAAEREWQQRAGPPR